MGRDEYEVFWIERRNDEVMWMDVQRTDAMNIPKRPPIPKPMTPAIADLPKQDSIIAFI